METGERSGTGAVLRANHGPCNRHRPAHGDAQRAGPLSFVPPHAQRVPGNDDAKDSHLRSPENGTPPESTLYFRSRWLARLLIGRWSS